MKVEGIDHIHVHVWDIEKAIELFSNLLGSEFIGPTAIDELKIKAAINTQQSSFR